MALCYLNIGKELDLLKDFIEYAEDAVECNKTEAMDSYGESVMCLLNL